MKLRSCAFIEGMLLEKKKIKKQKVKTIFKKKKISAKKKYVPVAPKRLELGAWSLERKRVAHLTFPSRTPPPHIFFAPKAANIFPAEGRVLFRTSKKKIDLAHPSIRLLDAKITHMVWFKRIIQNIKNLVYLELFWGNFFQFYKYF